MKGPLANIMQQAQRMQENLKRAQDEVGELQATGNAGGGMISITINGRHEVTRIKIDPSLLGGDLEMLEDLIIAASNDANNRITALIQTRMNEVTGGMQLPPGFKMPF
jgi:DNA-binding YbaB/EbfC family protein